MSKQSDLRPWYASLPLFGILLFAPFFLLLTCGPQFLSQPEEPTQKRPRLQVAETDTGVSVTVQGALSPFHPRFSRCDVQPTALPRFAICKAFDRTTVLASAKTEMVELIGLLVPPDATGGWSADGNTYLLWNKIIETSPSLRVASIPKPSLSSPTLSSSTPPSTEPRFVGLANHTRWAIWEDMRPHGKGATRLIVTHSMDGNVLFQLTLNEPHIVEQFLRKPFDPLDIDRLLKEADPFAHDTAPTATQPYDEAEDASSSQDTSVE